MCLQVRRDDVLNLIFKEKLIPLNYRRFIRQIAMATADTTARSEVNEATL